MVFMAAQRIWETFFRKMGKSGTIFKKWTFSVLSTLHVTIGIGTIVEYFVMQRTINLGVTLLGLIMFFSAFFFRTWVINILGEYHSIHIEIREDHPLMREGPYRYIRHPYYLSVIFELLGFPLIANAYYSFLCSLFVYLPFLLIRVHFEERAMTEKFGDAYLKYKSETWRFLPIKRK
jgi:isoprenylcysteine carboxyl methyltransferase (ICMT) family protein YpbQ